MTQTSKELTGRQRIRPIRIAFLVDPNEHGNLALDGIFADCYSRWGGRFSLVAPCAGGDVVSDYWPWLEAFDPDIVYSYVDLPNKTVLGIHERIGPADYIHHKIRDQARLELRSFRPNYPFTALSAMSAIFRLGRHSPLAAGPRLKIIDTWPTAAPTSFLLDNFGTYHTSAATGVLPADAQSTANLLTILSDDDYEKRENGVPRNLDRVASEILAFEAFANRRATSMSVLSSLYAPRLEIRDHRWSTSFNLVIGDSFEDRLLFWNARLLIPVWLDREVCSFRLTLDMFSAPEMLGQIAQLLNTHSHVPGANGGQPCLQVRSASHSVEELNQVIELLRRSKVWSVNGHAEVVLKGDVLPQSQSLHQARELDLPQDGFFTSAHWKDFRWTPPVARPPTLLPEHLSDAPAGQAFTLGLWALDMTFEYSEDFTRAGQGNRWTLPKRWRLAEAFVPEFLKQGFGQPSLRHRANRGGDLTLFPGRNRALESVVVPTIGQAIQKALCWGSPLSQFKPNDPPWPAGKAAWMEPSNEASYLAGVLGLVGGLAAAECLLLHPFWQATFANLGGAPNLADADIMATANSLAKRAKRNPLFDLKSEREREALASLIVKAAHSIKLPRLYVSLDHLRGTWKKYLENFWAREPEALKHLSETERKEQDRREQEAVDDVLAAMRTRRMLFQGWQWLCHTCQHRNWTDFKALTASLQCEVCNADTELPVGIPWYFRPNEFLIESLRSRSVLSVIWVLSALRDRAQLSFMYVGSSCFGAAREDVDPDQEADLLAIVDGVTILCEVKSSWRSLRAAHLPQFVSLALRLQPDLAILAIMEAESHLEKEINEASAALKANGIKFELLTPTQYRVRDDPYLRGY